jgi:antitoxin ParD1/3/4
VWRVFPIEKAARQLIDERIAARTTEEIDDLAWVKPCVDEALADVERGDVITLEEHEARTKALLAAITGSPRAPGLPSPIC